MEKKNKDCSYVRSFHLRAKTFVIWTHILIIQLHFDFTPKNAFHKYLQGALEILVKIEVKEN